MKPTYYYLNKYFYYPPYLLWVWLGERFTRIGNGKRLYLHYRIMRWIGNNVGFKGMTYLERYNHFNKLGEILNDSFTNIRN